VLPTETLEHGVAVYDDDEKAAALLLKGVAEEDDGAALTLFDVNSKMYSVKTATMPSALRNFMSFSSFVSSKTNRTIRLQYPVFLLNTSLTLFAKGSANHS